MWSKQPPWRWRREEAAVEEGTGSRIEREVRWGTAARRGNDVLREGANASAEEVGEGGGRGGRVGRDGRLDNVVVRIQMENEHSYTCLVCGLIYYLVWAGGCYLPGYLCGG